MFDKIREMKALAEKAAGIAEMLDGLQKADANKNGVDDGPELIKEGLLLVDQVAAAQATFGRIQALAGADLEIVKAKLKEKGVI